MLCNGDKKKQRPRTKEHAYIRRYQRVSRPYLATGVNVTSLIWLSETNQQEVQHCAMLTCIILMNSSRVCQALSWAAATPLPKTGALPKFNRRASGSNLCRLDLQELVGTCDRDRPSLHGLRNLAHEVDV